jgi:hypothetical protein
MGASGGVRGQQCEETFSFLCNYEKTAIETSQGKGEKIYKSENFRSFIKKRNLQIKLCHKNPSRIKTNNKKDKDTRGDHKFSATVSVKREKRKK